MIDYQVQCIKCRTVHTIRVPVEDVLKWQMGALIQVAMPYLSPGTRELLISGMCETCFDKMFKE